MANQNNKKTDAIIPLKNFKYAEEEFYRALDELERVYYLMDDNDSDIGYVRGYLEQYGCLSADECEMEEKLVKEYETAKNENADENEMNEIYNKIRVTIRRNSIKGGILNAILADDGKLNEEEA